MIGVFLSVISLFVEGVWDGVTNVDPITDEQILTLTYYENSESPVLDAMFGFQCKGGTVFRIAWKSRSVTFAGMRSVGVQYRVDSDEVQEIVFRSEGSNRIGLTRDLVTEKEGIRRFMETLMSADQRVVLRAHGETLIVPMTVEAQSSLRHIVDECRRVFYDETSQ